MRNSIIRLFVACVIGAAVTGFHVRQYLKTTHDPDYAGLAVFTGLLVLSISAVLVATVRLDKE